MKVIEGIAAAEGKVMGKALCLSVHQHSAYSEEKIDSAQVKDQLEALANALEELKADMRHNIERSDRLGKASTAAVMSAHLQMLEDPELLAQLEGQIAASLATSRAAVQLVFDEWISCFKQLEDAYLRERSHDLEDIKQQLLNKLCGVVNQPLDRLNEPVVIVATDVTPSMLASADTSYVLGIVSEIGSKTSHTAILAANLGLPAVLGVKNALTLIEAGSLVCIDGSKGQVYTELDEAEKSDCLLDIAQRKAAQQRINAYKNKKTLTADQFAIELSANIMGLEDAELAVLEGAEGVGLFRTEFLFMDRLNAPSEEEQYTVYAKTASLMGDKPIIIRTMDIGGDKTVSYLNMAKEENPFLGLRALRLSFEREEIFITQLRAILRASAQGNIKVMFPMVASVEELLKAKALLERAKAELDAQGLAYNPQLPVGVMIEIPSAAIVADQMIKHCDFFSIGTNDLTQYTLAVDRMNEHIAHLYNPVHPAMLRLIGQVAAAANGQGGAKFAGMCGELAGNPAMAKLLIGLGLTELSMSPRKISKMREAISQFTLAEAKAFAQELLAEESASAILERLT